MKHPGSRSDFLAARSKELITTFQYHLRTSPPSVLVPQLLTLTANSPSSRFWVTEERAADVLLPLLKGTSLPDNMRPLKRAMYSELYRHLIVLLKSEPQLPLPIAIHRVVNSPAPSFYLSPRHVERLISPQFLSRLP